MYIAYIDESGDDGFPKYSSEFFVLSSVYFNHENWQSLFKQIRDMRVDLQKDFGLPVKFEMHTKDFLLNKGMYQDLSVVDKDRLLVIDRFCNFIGQLELKIINTVIVKPRIQKRNYDVLDIALKYTIQRIENDLITRETPQEKFMIISDPGRVGKMRKTTRKIQRINFIPSKYYQSSYRKEISTLIEDPLEKDSKESYFIQIADLVSLVIYLHSSITTGVGQISGRLTKLITPAIVDEWMESLKPCFNLLASSKNKYGIVYHPE